MGITDLLYSVTQKKMFFSESFLWLAAAVTTDRKNVVIVVDIQYNAVKDRKSMTEQYVYIDL